MASSISALRAEIEILHTRVTDLQICLSRQPDATYRTGRIRGDDSRYTLRVWYRRYGAICLVTHRHPGQSDSVDGPFTLEHLATQYASTSEEGAALSGLVNTARHEFYRHESAADAQLVTHA